jgi:hypothetical protein
MRKMKERTIQEENLQMLRRLQEGEPVMKIEQLEDGFKNHLKFKKIIKKVGNGFNKLYKENQLPPININKQSKSFYKKLKSSFSSLDTVNNNNPYSNDYDQSHGNRFVQYSKMGLINLNSFQGFEKEFEN